MTGSQLLIETLEDFGNEGEPIDVVVVYSDENGNAVVKSNGGCTRTIGLARYAEEYAMAKLLGSPANKKLEDQ